MTPSLLISFAILVERLLLSLTHRHQRHTNHNTAGRAPQGDTERTVPESRRHTFSWPTSLCGHSSEKCKEKVAVSEHAWVDMCACACVCAQTVYSTHSTRISEVLVSHVRAGRADLPGVSKQLRCRLHNALSCSEVVLCIPIKVTTKPSHPTLQVGCQTHIHSHTWK